MTPRFHPRNADLVGAVSTCPPDRRHRLRRRPLFLLRRLVFELCVTGRQTAGRQQRETELFTQPRRGRTWDEVGERGVRRVG